MQISTVSPMEMIQLYSSFIYNTTDALNCNKTEKRAGKDAARIQHNCDFKYKRKVFEMDDIVWHSCLCRFLHPNFNTLMVLNKNYEKGVLPQNGSLMDQPNRIVEQMEALDYLKDLHKLEQHKEMERKNNGRSKHRSPAESRKRAPRTQTGPRTNK